MWRREMCVDEGVQNLILLFDSSPTLQHWSYKNNCHKMAALVVSLVSRTKQLTTYFRFVQWPSDLLTALEEISHVPFHSGHSLWGKILLCCFSDQFSQLLPSGTCLLFILISGTTAREGVALLCQGGLPCLMVERKCVNFKHTVLIRRSRQNKHYPPFINSWPALANI